MLGDDRLLALHRLRAASSLVLAGADDALRRRMAEFDEAESDLWVAADRAAAARWRVLLACGRLERAGRLAAQVADRIGSVDVGA
jgi:hypothetical protein